MGGLTRMDCPLRFAAGRSRVTPCGAGFFRFSAKLVLSSSVI